MRWPSDHASARARHETLRRAPLVAISLLVTPGCAARVGPDAAGASRDTGVTDVADRDTSMRDDLAPTSSCDVSPLPWDDAGAAICADAIAAEPLAPGGPDAGGTWCRWQPALPIERDAAAPDALDAADASLDAGDAGAVPTYVETAVTTTDGVWAGTVGRNLGEAFIQRFAFDGTLLETRAVEGCPASGAGNAVALGHGMLGVACGHDGTLDTDLVATNDGWSLLGLNLFAIVLRRLERCGDVATRVGLLELPGGNFLNSAGRAKFADESFLLAWDVGNGTETLRVARYCADGTRVAPTRVVATSDHARLLPAVAPLDDGAVLVWAELPGPIRLMFVSRDGEPRRGPIDVSDPQPATVARAIYERTPRLLVGPTTILVWWLTPDGVTNLRTLTRDGTPIGDPVLVPGFDRGPIVATPAGALLLGPTRGVPLVCSP